MIKNIRLKFGRAQGINAEPIQTPSITVFVGPNNSGKSKVLAELHSYCTSGVSQNTDVILDQVEFEVFSPLDAEEEIKQVTLKPKVSETVHIDHVIVGKRGARVHVPKPQLVNALVEPNNLRQQFCGWYLAYNTLILDGKNRINLTNPQPAGDLLQAAQTSFQALFRNNERRNEVRRIINEAFDLYLVVDPTHLGHLRLRLASRAPNSKIEERGIHEDAIR